MRATLRRFAALVARPAAPTCPGRRREDLPRMLALSLVGALERVIDRVAGRRAAATDRGDHPALRLGVRGGPRRPRWFTAIWASAIAGASSSKTS